jgi:PPOX class probable FMN-dependent enzyme
MRELDPFAEAITSEAELRALYDDPESRAWRKDIGHLDGHCRTLIAASPMVMVGSFDPDGRCDVTPRGGPAGFVGVRDERHLILPDATGNRRIDTLRNVVATGRLGLLFLIPGRDTTLRVNGRACVTAADDVLDAVDPVGKRPVTAIVVEAEEVYVHCPKAFVRSGLWKPESWPALDVLPSSARIMRDHLDDPGLTVEDVEGRERDALLHRLE